MLAINYMEKGELVEAKLLLERLAEESNSFYKIHYVSDCVCVDVEQHNLFVICRGD